MRRTAIAGVFCTLLVLGGSEAAEKAAPKRGKPAAKAAAKPAVFVSKAGRFSVAASGTPQEEQKQLGTPETPLVVHFYKFNTSTRVQKLVTWSDYPGNEGRETPASDLLDAERDGLLGSVNGELISEGKIAHYQHPGREVRIEFRERFRILARLYVVGNRLYQVAFAAEKEQFPEAEARKFVESFSLLK